MSIAAAQHDKFMTQVAQERRVFSFTDEGQLLIYPTARGDVIPFWSSRGRLVAIQKRSAKYQQWAITELSLEEFQTRLAQLERERLLVGVNWSGSELTGYNVPVSQLRASLEHALQQVAGAPSTTSSG